MVVFFIVWNGFPRPGRALVALRHAGGKQSNFFAGKKAGFRKTTGVSSIPVMMLPWSNEKPGNSIKNR
jgi:hypothetical protein